MIGWIFLSFWRFAEVITLIPTLGMLAYFVNGYNKANLLTPPSILVLFIVTVLATVWALMTWLRRKSTRNSALYVAFIDLCFVGAFIAGVYELRGIANADCSNFQTNGGFYLSISSSGFSGSSPFSVNIDKTCAMLKASFAFGIMNIIFFAITSGIILFLHRTRDDRDVVVKESYHRRRSHDSRRGHSRSGSSHHRRSSRDSRRNYYV